MYKASIEIAKINKGLKIKFGIIIYSESENKQIYSKLVSKFNYLGNDFLKVNPKPFITLDISSNTTKSEGWSSNQFVNLNKQSLFLFNRALYKLIQEFKEIRELFYYKNNKLCVNNKEAERITKDIISNNKHIRLQPCVVPSDENNEKFYEGCVLCINTYDNFVYITYSEMEYLYYELSHVDMINLSLSMIQMAKIYKDEEVEQIHAKPITKIEEPEENEISSRPYVKIEDSDTIPNI